MMVSRFINGETYGETEVRDNLAEIAAYVTPVS
jgi:hypothetical protein